MACVNEKGQLTDSARSLLEVIKEQRKTPEDIAKSILQPLFKVRSSLRDMKSMGFVDEQDGAYMIHEQARKYLQPK